MKNYTVALALFAICSVAFSQTGCDTFKTGKFQNTEKGEIKSTYERNDSIQIEYLGDIVVKTRIEWTSDCSYRLIFLEGNEAFWESRPADKPTPVLLVTITRTKKDRYWQEARFEGVNDFVYKSVVLKIK